MSEGPESLKSPHQLVLPENVSKSAFYTVILGEMDPKVAKLVNLSLKWVPVRKIPGNRPKMDETKKILRIMFIHVEWHQKKGVHLFLRIVHFNPYPFL